MTLKLAAMVLAAAVVAIPCEVLYAQDKTPPAGDVKALETPIDQRPKQHLDNALPPTTATKDSKLPAAPDQKDKGTTDAR